MADPIQALRHAVEYTTRAVHGARQEQYDLPTPCADWDVRTLIAHMIDGARGFIGALGGTVDDGTPSDGDLTAVFDQTVGAEVAAFEADGALDQVIDRPFPGATGAVGARIHAMDLLVHGWDLARATGQDAPLDEAMADDTIDFMRPIVAGLTRGEPGSAFGHEVTVPDGAPSADRLLALLGRTP